MINISELAENFKAGKRSALARAITLIESQRESDQPLIQQFLEKIETHHADHQAKVIAFTGTPGVGKSSFIESYALNLLSADKGHNAQVMNLEEPSLGVLAIDPSSQKSGGSILGDKTRMDRLSKHSQSFIRPTPAGNHLGGVSLRTGDVIYLCERFGLEYIFIETVGVGQSEIEVSLLADMLIYLSAPVAGDELQGIKRGLLETVDLALVNKADGDHLSAAERTATSLTLALKILLESKPPQVILTSSIERKNFDLITREIEKYFKDYQFTEQRKLKAREWIDLRLWQELKLTLHQQEFFKTRYFKKVNNLKSSQSVANTITEIKQWMIDSLKKNSE